MGRCGWARAACFNELPFVEVRGIMDTADHQAAADFVASLPLFMANLTHLIALWRTAV